MSSFESSQKDDNLFLEIQEESNCRYIPWHSQPFPFHGYGPVIPSNAKDLKKSWIFARKYPNEMEEKVHTQWRWRVIDGVGKVRYGKAFEPRDKSKMINKRVKHGIILREERIPEIICPEGAAMFKDPNSTEGSNARVIVYIDPRKNGSVCFTSIYEHNGKLYTRLATTSSHIELMKRVLASSLHDSIAAISDNMISWYRQKNTRLPIRRYRQKNTRLPIRKYRTEKRILDAAWDTNDERLLILFEDEFHLIGPHEQQTEIIEASLTSDAKAIFTFDGSVLVSMHGHFYKMCLETGGFNEFSTDFEFGNILFLISSDVVTGTPWLAAFASDKMIGIIDTRNPTLPLASWTLDQFTGSFETKIHSLAMANLKGIEHIIVSANGFVIGVPLHYEIVAGHRLICGRPVMLYTRSSNPDLIHIKNPPKVVGMAGDAETGRVYAVYEDGTIGCTFTTADTLESQTSLVATVVKPRSRTRSMRLDFRPLLPLLKQHETKISTFTFDPLLYGECSRQYTKFPEDIRLDKENRTLEGPRRMTGAVEALTRNWNLTVQDDQETRTDIDGEISEGDDTYSMMSVSDDNMRHDNDDD